MWKIKFRPASIFRLDYEWLLVSAAVILVLLSWISVDPVILRFLSTNKSDLSLIGEVVVVEGVVQRKVLHDSILIPIQKGDPLFDGDLIETVRSGRAEFELGPGFGMTLPAGAKIQMFFEDQNLRLHLMNGYVLLKTEFARSIVVSTGLLNQSIELEPGLTFIRPTIEGVVAERATGDEWIQPLIHDINLYMNKRYKIERLFAVVDSQEIWAKKEEFGDPQELSADKVRLGASRVPSTFPQPENKIVFLMNVPDTIRIAARPLCEESCELIIKKDRRIIVKESFFRGQRPVHELTVDSLTDSKFEWTFTDEAYHESFEFKVQPFTEENFQKSLSQGYNIEIR
ncbi:MAG: hypothetical protein RJB66_1848 [Pseudomonadota bacterium]|jgi:hypothetical protein